MSQRKSVSMVRLYDEDVAAAQNLQETFDLNTMSQAVRYALRVAPKRLEVLHGSV